MSIVAEIQQRLLAIDPPVFSIVDDAIALGAVTGRPNATPAAYVFVKEEAAEPNERATGQVIQRVQGDIAVVIITDNVSDTTGGAAGADLEALKKAVRQRIIGLVPAASQDGTPIEFVSGAVVQFRSGCVWHEQLFSAAWYEEEEA